MSMTVRSCSFVVDSNQIEMKRPWYLNALRVYMVFLCFKATNDILADSGCMRTWNLYVERMRKHESNNH